jgi:hypothetical protein
VRSASLFVARAAARRCDAFAQPCSAYRVARAALQGKVGGTARSLIVAVEAPAREEGHHLALAWGHHALLAKLRFRIELRMWEKGGAGWGAMAERDGVLERAALDARRTFKLSAKSRWMRPCVRAYRGRGAAH